MGGCSSVNYPTYNTNNPKDKIGEKKLMKNACVPWGQEFSLNKYVPNNGEYVRSTSTHDCYFWGKDWPSSINCSSGCMSGGCSIIGSQGYYHRVAYLADPRDCCRTGLEVINGKTCDPNLDCSNIMFETCPGKTKTASECIKWCSKNKTLCRDLEIQTCRKNPNSSGCIELLRENSGLLDDIAYAFCEKHPDDDICSCLKSGLNSYSKYNPLCADIACITRGYPTSGMIASRGDGCNIIDCSTVFKIQSSGKVDLKENSFNKECGNNKKQPNPIFFSVILLILLLLFVTLK